MERNIRSGSSLTERETEMTKTCACTLLTYTAGEIIFGRWTLMHLYIYPSPGVKETVSKENGARCLISFGFIIKLHQCVTYNYLIIYF